MKILLVGLVLLLSSFSSCNKDDETYNPGTITQLNSTLTAGTWRISYYRDSDQDETSLFTGYVFTFNANGGLTAVKAPTTLTGTWSTRTDDAQLKLYITFTTPATFVEISDDWQVIERTDTRIKLQDVSGGGGGTELLTFERN